MRIFTKTIFPGTTVTSLKTLMAPKVSTDLRNKARFPLIVGQIFILMTFCEGQLNAQIAKWTFEGVVTTNTGSAPIVSSGNNVADIGTQTTGSAFTASHFSAGTVWSNPAGNGSSKSVSSNSWSVNDYYQFKVSTTGYENIVVTFDQTGSGTGPKNFTLSYSTDGSSFIAITSYSLTGESWSTGTTNANL